jgi:hypothetical protein
MTCLFAWFFFRFLPYQYWGSSGIICTRFPDVRMRDAPSVLNVHQSQRWFWPRGPLHCIYRSKLILQSPKHSSFSLPIFAHVRHANRMRIRYLWLCTGIGFLRTSRAVFPLSSRIPRLWRCANVQCISRTLLSLWKAWQCTLRQGSKFVMHEARALNKIVNTHLSKQ